MKLYKARVEDVVGSPDPTAILCSILRQSNASGKKELVQVYYTAPYNATFPGGGGFTAYPQKGDIVIIATLDNDVSTNYFYVSTVVGLNLTLEESGPNTPKGSKDLGSGNSRKRTVGLSDHRGGSLEFVDESGDSESTGPIRKNFVKMADGTGNQVMMNRVPVNSSVTLNTPNEEVKLKLSGRDNQNSIFGPNSLLAKAAGNIAIQSTRGSMRISNAAEAKTIDIVNSGRTDVIDGLITDVLRGDINIRSLHNTVNVMADSFLPFERPGVFIGTNSLHQAGVVQLRTGGTIELVSDSTVATVGVNPDSGKIFIKATGDINIISDTGDVNISAPTGNVNLQPVTPPTFIRSTDNKEII